MFPPRLLHLLRTIEMNVTEGFHLLRFPALRCLLPLALLAFPVGGLAAQEAVPTRILVRAVSQDAKIIGSGVGGARIVIRQAATGAILAEGVQEGGTGDTRAIMSDRPRVGPVFAAEGAAAFEAVLELTEPTPVVVEAEGPLGTPHALQKASATLLMVPGYDVVGEGVILTLHGFTVEVVDAPEAVAAGGSLAVEARVTMLCGCPTEPGGMWDADRTVLEVALLREGRVVARTPLEFSGETSHYRAALAVPSTLAPGGAQLRILAVDAERANAGMAVRDVRIDP